MSLHKTSKMDRDKMIFDQSLHEYSNMHVGGVARKIEKPESREDLIDIVRYSLDMGNPYYVRGFGKNIIFGDIHGVLISTTRLNGLHVNKDLSDKIKQSKEGSKFFIEADTGFPFQKLSNWGAKHGLTGLEYASGIPGSVGGAAVMNAGVSNDETKDIIYLVRAIDQNGRTKKIYNKKMEYGYRDSIFLKKDHDGCVIYSVIFKLTKGNPKDIREKMTIKHNDRDDEPIGRSVGSFFMRRDYHGKGSAPLTTDELISDSGCGGMRSKDGFVYVPDNKHFMSFLVAETNLSKTKKGLYSVLELAKNVYDTVLQKEGVKLKTEVRFIGDVGSGKNRKPLKDYVEELFSTDLSKNQEYMNHFKSILLDQDKKKIVIGNIPLEAYKK